LAASAATVGLALLPVGSASAADDQTPFAASLIGQVTDTDCAPLTICLSGSDQGVATHFGRAMLAKIATIHISFASCDGGGLLTTYTESATLTGAKGDTLNMTGDGTACVIAGHAIASGVLTVTGGTGRFAAATGAIDESIDHDLVTDAETVRLSGTISVPGQPTE
jgi:hypothetical protein